MGLRIRSLILVNKGNKVITKKFNKAGESKTIVFINKEVEWVNKKIFLSIQIQMVYIIRAGILLAILLILLFLMTARN